MSKRRIALLGCLVLAVAACGSAERARSTTTPNTTSAPASELDAARARWTALGLDSYSLEYHEMCGECSTLNAQIYVSGGKVDEVVPIDPSREVSIGDAPTVEHLFAEVERAAREATGEVTVVYDPTTGVPTSASIDWLKDAVDDEGGWTVSLLEQELTATEADLMSARARWEAQALDTYTFEYQETCLCPALDVRIHVSDGKVDEVLPLDDSRELPLVDAPTIDHLFDELARATREATGEVTIAYDPITGVPINASIDWLKDAVDDEIGWTVTLVTPAVTSTSGDS